MKKLLGIAALSLVIYFNPITVKNLNAGWFDPTMGGCVFQEPEFNNKKIKCVSIKFNEAKDPGSMRRAEKACYRELNHYGKKYGKIGYWIDGCLPSGQDPY